MFAIIFQVVKRVLICGLTNLYKGWQVQVFLMQQLHGRRAGMAAAQENIKLPWYVVDGHGNAGLLKNMWETKELNRIDRGASSQFSDQQAKNATSSHQQLSVHTASAPSFTNYIQVSVIKPMTYKI